MIKTIEETDIEDKRVFLRLDLNVPMPDGVVDDFKIVSALPTIEHICSRRPRSLVIGSHLGRPGGRHSESLSLRPVYEVLRDMLRSRLDVDLKFCGLEEVDCRDRWVMLENLRFHSAEESCEGEDGYREMFTRIADMAVVDAFGCLHRECGSIWRTGLPSCAGLLVEKELALAADLLDADINLMILGGKKVSDKIALISSLGRQGALFVVGGLAFSFLKHRSRAVGASIVDEDAMDDVENICRLFGDRVVLPVDFVVQDGDQALVCEVIPEDAVGLDIGPRTVEMLRRRISSVENVFWNGPPGVFEREPFSTGTRELVQMLGDMGKRGGRCFCGGGETALAVRRFGCSEDFAHVSTGGGALMQLLGGGRMPGLEFLER